MIELFNLYMNNYYKKNKLFILSFISITVIYVILESVIMPYFFGKLINNINSPMFYLQCIVFLYIIIYIFNHFKQKLESNLIPDLLTNPRTLFFSSLIDKYSENFKLLKMGSTISRINLVSYVFRECILHFIVDILPHIIIIISLSLVFLYLNINIGLFILFALTLFLITVLILKNNIYNKIKYITNYYYKIDNELNDIFSSLMNTYLNNNEVKEKERIKNLQNIYNVGIKEIHIQQNFMNNILYLITIILSILSLYFICMKGDNKEDKIIKIILLIYLINSFIHLTKIIPMWLYQYSIAIESNNYIKYILNINQNNSEKEILYGNIELKNLNFGYKKNNIILKNINLIIKNKEKVAIIGRSGSGKSSLSKLLLKFHKYDGEIYIDNKNIKQINTKYLRNKLLYANQKTILYDISVMDNIKYGNNTESEYILKLLTDYELLEIFSGIKDGIYGNAGVQGNELSGGMQKLVIILRTILKSEEANSLIIIFDEPLAGLDSSTRKKVIKLINDKCSDKTLIIITHDKEILPYMNRIIDLSEINNIGDKKVKKSLKKKK